MPKNEIYNICYGVITYDERRTKRMLAASVLLIAAGLYLMAVWQKDNGNKKEKE